MRKRQKLLAIVLICIGAIAAILVSPGLALGIAAACLIILWIDYDETAYKAWVRMYHEIVLKEGGFWK